MEELGGRLCPGFGREESREADFLVDRAIAEDLPAGDITTEALFASRGSPEPRVRLAFVSREPGVLCGLGTVSRLLEKLRRSHPGGAPAELAFEACRSDGDELVPSEPFLAVSGPVHTLLAAERIALNFLQRLSGIATLTRRWVRELEGLETVLLDTRKTTPGWRLLEKYAVRTGGGRNHRLSLSDGYLVKDNHLAVLRRLGPLRPADWVARLRSVHPDAFLEVEVDGREDFLAVREAGVDAILLDNFSLEDLRWAVEENRSLGEPRPLLEASGGITKATLRAVAETGVDRISSGAITHSVRSLDIGLDFDTEAAGSRALHPGGSL